MTDLLWNYEDPITDLLSNDQGMNEEVKPPRWIDQDISPSTVAAIIQGDCASGAYMPAVTYHEALKTMHQHGDLIFDYIINTLGHLPPAPMVEEKTPRRPYQVESWSGLAVFYLSAAVELWAHHIEDDLRQILTDEEKASAGNREVSQ